MRKFLLLVVIFSISTVVAYPQSNMAVTEEQAKEFYKDLKSALEAFSGSSNPEMFYNFFDDSFKGTVITLRPLRQPVIKTRDYATLFSDIRKNFSYNSKYQYKNITLEGIIINKPYAILSIQHEYAIIRDDEVRMEGTNIVSYVLKNINNKIKIVSSSTVSNIPAEYVGDCYCRFYNENNDYLITVEHPYGNDFKRVVESIYKIPGDRNLFNYDGKTYHWDGTSKVFRYNPATDSDGVAIGDATSLDMSMVRVLQKVAYEEICLNMRIFKN